MVKTILRTIGCAVYSSLLSAGFGLLAGFMLVKVLHAEGFWNTALLWIGMGVCLAWVTEKGFLLLSIPYNFLWDQSSATRVVTAIPPVLAGIWMVWAPWRIEMSFTVCDWVISVTWMFMVATGYFNLASMSIINPGMGAQSR